MFTVKSIKIYEGCKYVKNLKTGKTYRFEHRLSPDFFSDHICISASVKGGEILNLEHCAQGITISVDTSLNPNMDHNEEMFHLEQIYQTHTDYAAEIYIKKVMKENDIYLHATKGMLKKHRINLTNDDVRRIVNGFYTNPNDFSKRPLSKFRTDLSKDVGLV